MKYYLISTDYNNPFPEIINWYKKIDPRQINVKNFGKISQWTLLEMNADKETVFPDILSDPYFLLSAAAMDLVRDYEPDIKATGVRLCNYENLLNKEYYLPLLPVVCCLSEKSDFIHKDMDIRKGVIIQEKTKDRSLFRLGGIEADRVAVRMDLLEILLRREAYGLQLEELEVI